MNCVNHPAATATAYCRTCGKPLCEACQRTAQGTIFCPEHAPMPAAAAQPPVTPEPPVAAPPPHAAEPPAANAFSGTAAGVPPPPYTPPESGAIPIPPSGAQYSPYAVPGATPLTAVDASASPGLAFILGLIPGVGAIYNGQYVKGLIHVIILGLLLSITTSEAAAGLQPVFVLVTIAFWIYMAFEAYHTARKRQFGLPVDEFSSIVPLRPAKRGLPIGPVILIVLGILFLLNTMEVIRFTQLLRYWPVLLIALGAYMLYERMTGASSSAVAPLDAAAAREVGHEPR